MTDTNREIIQLLENYFARQSMFDGDGMLEFWHPGGRMYLVGNQNEFRVVTIEEQASHIKDAKERVPDLKVEFILEEIEQVVVQEDLIASAHVRYRMIFPEGYGKHRCFYHLAKIEGKWGIVNVVDRGVQVLSAEEQGV
jgi:hypothetical protein